MSNSPAKLIVAFAAAVTLASATELRAQASAEKAADDKCLSAPNGAGPAGSHWFYRIDRATKRQCWYLKEAGDKAGSRPQETGPAPSTAAAAQPPLTITQKSIANARAEWLSQQARPQPTPAELQTAAADGRDDRRKAGGQVPPPASPAAARWPDTIAANPAAESSATADASTDPSQQAEAAQQTAAPAPATVATEPARPAASLQMLLLAIAAALGMAGIIVSLVFRIGRVRARRAMRRRREAMWESVPVKRAPTAVRRSPQLQPAPRAEPQRTLRPRLPDERERQMNDMLARLARSLQT